MPAHDDAQLSDRTRATERTALEEQLIQLIGQRLLDPVEILLGDQEAGFAGPSTSAGSGDDAEAAGPVLAALRTTVRQKAAEWAECLLGPDNRQATQVLARLIGALYPSDQPFEPPPGWWQTPLGRVTGRRLGHPAVSAVSYAVAGTMLGITRQGVHDLVARGKLARHPDGGVTVESVRDRLRAKDAAPEAVKAKRERTSETRSRKAP